MSKLIGSSLTKSFLLKSNSSAKSKVLVNSCVYLDHVSVKQKQKKENEIHWGKKRNLNFFFNINLGSQLLVAGKRLLERFYRQFEGGIQQEQGNEREREKV